MRVKSNKGQILAIVIFFIIVSVITSVALYYWAFSISKEVAIQSPEHMRNYYAAVAGQRFAAILLKDPETNLNDGPQLPAPISYTIDGGTTGEGGRMGITTLPHNGETVTLRIPHGSSFGTDIKLGNNKTMFIEIKEYDPENAANTPWTANEYNVTVTIN